MSYKKHKGNCSCPHDMNELMSKNLKDSSTLFYLKCLECGSRHSFRNRMSDLIEGALQHSLTNPQSARNFVKELFA